MKKHEMAKKDRLALEKELLRNWRQKKQNKKDRNSLYVKAIAYYICRKLKPYKSKEASDE